MKKLNEDLLRKLIIETIEEDYVAESRKKIKENEPVPEAEEDQEEGSDYFSDATGMNNPDFDMPDEQVAQMTRSFSPEQIKNAHEALDKAFELAKSNNSLLSGSPEDLLKQITNMFKGKD